MRLLVLCIFVTTALGTSIPEPNIFIENDKTASFGLKKELNSPDTVEFWNEMFHALKEIFPDMAEVIEVAPETADPAKGAAVVTSSLKPPVTKTSPKPSKTTSKPTTTSLKPSDKETWDPIYLGSDCLKTLDFIARHCQMTCKRP